MTGKVLPIGVTTRFHLPGTKGFHGMWDFSVNTGTVLDKEDSCWQEDSVPPNMGLFRGCLSVLMTWPSASARVSDPRESKAGAPMSFLTCLGSTWRHFYCIFSLEASH